ncbi:MAG: hypothetical protein H0V82_10380 [Candidatus Protochlamydia sp.]|nr:hypothetical protein [Candidatus Protochlamydia sp.]
MNNTNIVNVPNDAMLEVMSYLDIYDLASMKEINKKYKVLADSKQLYQSENFILKEKFSQFIECQAKIESKKNKQASVKLLITENQSILDYLPLKIKNLSYWLYPSAYEKIQIRESVQKDIETIQNEIEEMDIELQHLKKNSFLSDDDFKKISILKKEGHNLKWQRYYYEDYEKKMVSNGYGHKAEQKIFKFIMSLFGGKEDFEALPELKLDKSLDKSFSDLKISDLSAPIMRGTTLDGREFIVSRWDSPSEKQLRVSVLSQYTSGDYNTWMSQRDSGPFEYGIYIDEGKINIEAIQSLKEVLKTKKFKGLSGSEYSIV